MAERPILYIVENPAIEISDGDKNLSYFEDWRELKEQELISKTGMIQRPTPGIWSLAQRGVSGAVDMTNRYRLMQKSTNTVSLQSSSS
jgi:hypothetical protein